MKTYLINVLICILIAILAGFMVITHFAFMDFFSPKVGTGIYLGLLILIGSGIFTYFTKEKERG